jgi:hypothetical protein
VEHHYDNRAVEHALVAEHGIGERQSHIPAVAVDARIFEYCSFAYRRFVEHNGADRHADNMYRGAAGSGYRKARRRFAAELHGDERLHYLCGSDDIKHQIRAQARGFLREELCPVGDKADSDEDIQYRHLLGGDEKII